MLKIINALVIAAFIAGTIKVQAFIFGFDADVWTIIYIIITAVFGYYCWTISAMINIIDAMVKESEECGIADELLKVNTIAAGGRLFGKSVVWINPLESPNESPDETSQKYEWYRVDIDLEHPTTKVLLAALSGTLVLRVLLGHVLKGFGIKNCHINSIHSAIQLLCLPVGAVVIFFDTGLGLMVAYLGYAWIINTVMYIVCCEITDRITARQLGKTYSRSAIKRALHRLDETQF